MNRIKIDLDRVLSDIDRNIFGGYMELGSKDTMFKHLDILDPARKDKGLSSEVMEALEPAKMANIRFGGNFFSGYRWRDGVGPRAERPARHELAWNSLVPNNFGTNEFVMLCRTLGAEPYLNTNCGDGDMREAADWVEYCNSAGNSELANLRRAHGFEKPHNVKYWSIGNEVDSPGQIGYKTPQEYARAATEYSKVMKRVDPSIKLTASATCSWEDFPLGPQFLYRKTEWVERAQLILEQAGDRIDYMALHKYAHPYTDDSFETLMAFAAGFEEHIHAYEGIIKAVSMERGIKHAVAIAVDEWGIIYIPEELRREAPITVIVDESGRTQPQVEKSPAHPRRKNSIGLEQALLTALHLNTFIRHARSVRLANCTSMPTPACLSFPEPESIVLRQAIYFPFELYSRTCGQLALDVFRDGDTFSGAYKGRAYNGIRILDVSATLDTERKQLVIYAVNQSPDKAMETTISLDAGAFAGNVKASIVNGPDIKAANTTEKPDNVGVHETVIKAAGKTLTTTFEPHSVTVLVCPVG
jgi:alpha-N-arabinofuranosidase